MGVRLLQRTSGGTKEGFLEPSYKDVGEDFFQGAERHNITGSCMHIYLFFLFCRR